jgi:Tol biopolymer transport system component
VRDLQTNATTRVSVASDGTEGNGMAYGASISGDGRYVSFLSEADNLVGGDTNGVRDIFLRDTQTNTTTRVSMTADGAQSNGWSYESAISADGRAIAFVSSADNLVNDDTNEAMDVFVLTSAATPPPLFVVDSVRI